MAVFMLETETKLKCQLLKQKHKIDARFQKKLFRLVTFWVKSFTEFQILPWNFFWRNQILEKLCIEKITFSFILPHRNDRFCIFNAFSNARFWRKILLQTQKLKLSFHSLSDFEIIFLSFLILNWNFDNASDSETSFLKCVKFTEENFWSSKDRSYLNWRKTFRVVFLHITKSSCRLQYPYPRDESNRYSIKNLLYAVWQGIFSIFFRCPTFFSECTLCMQILAAAKNARKTRTIFVSQISD